MKTFDLWRTGMNVLQIAESLKIQTTTVYSHLAQLITENKINNYNTIIADYEIVSVKNAIAKLGGTELLKPIYDQLDGAIEYGKIRVAISILKKDGRI
ncbi:MAG: helix-turn-helix domain-containing protein [Bacteroidales bacterium]|nr:helix-turn-helix domain-containing protein [Bacteroidales bacterium]